MHFTFTYIPHHIEKLQEYLDFLFFEVWLKADGEFDADKLKGHKQLQQIYLDLGNTEGKWAHFFNSSIENIYREFLDLDKEYKKYLSDHYINNNNIEGLCTNKDLQPITYNQITFEHESLSKELKSFYSKLYGAKSPFNLEIFGFLNKELIADFDSKFNDANKKQVCPFCALVHLKGNNHSYREAYDHYIPKGSYPFNVLNFKNLAPMCNECNSTYKLSVDPISDIDPLKLGAARSLAFYPYADIHPDLKFEIELKSSRINSLTPNDIEVRISADEGFEEEIYTWLRVFGIKERYKATLCSPNDGKVWFNSVLEEFENAKEQTDSINPEIYYKAILNEAGKYPLSNKGFLKSKFLEACKEKGLFDTI
ncbi:hypothetical protein [Maribacter hydrothermalis]|uniref:HNH endonuclease n=1 Tax=Maribacter hydrothermalis TaxID=1836467 RepID=A0A1B7ZD39_9FLAO|nr:hypothetical protein [Maribacter hydrothermalis]APQ18786.1 hypothetical protein BTR34_16330 [Maribacter hydrothermalis]OBR41030.1 hypothetical protein A9200_14505 [Maribacter hydrothermalis]